MITPKNETELIILFVERFSDKMEVIAFSPASFPDAILRDRISGEVYKVEFELYSSGFIEHGHNPNECDIIICWENDFPVDSSFPIWELSKNFIPDTKKTLEDINKILEYMMEYFIRRDKKRTEKLGAIIEKSFDVKDKKKDWRKVRENLSREELEHLSRLTRGQMIELAKKEGLTERTIQNWKNNAINELGLL